jgi:hypothetical protein
MKKAHRLLIVLLLLKLSMLACKKETTSPGSPQVQTGTVSGKAIDRQGNPLAGVKIIIEHTVWHDTYTFATTDSKGNYKVNIPSEPAGSWTAKAQIERTSYNEDYTFDLEVDNDNTFTVKDASVRNFTWKLEGERPGGGYYGAHIDLYQFGTDVNMTDVKLILTPYNDTPLVDGSEAATIERTIEDVAGTFMAKDIPIGTYNVKAVYQGKTLLLRNRHKDEEATETKTVVFGKNGMLAATEYNIEYWLSE